MATAPQTPQKTDMHSGDTLRSREQLRRDRINLTIVIAVFAALIGLMIWLATLSPPTGGMNFGYPPMP
jgi:hypothetical protein